MDDNTAAAMTVMTVCSPKPSKSIALLHPSNSVRSPKDEIGINMLDSNGDKEPEGRCFRCRGSIFVTPWLLSFSATHARHQLVGAKHLT